MKITIFCHRKLTSNFGSGVLCDFVVSTIFYKQRFSTSESLITMLATITQFTVMRFPVVSKNVGK